MVDNFAQMGYFYYILISDSEKRKKVLYKHEKERLAGCKTGKFAVDYECDTGERIGFPH